MEEMLEVLLNFYLNTRKFNTTGLISLGFFFYIILLFLNSRGLKDTLWEGGVRGVGLIHSPLIVRQGYVSNKMLHVCDWLPTLISAAGGKHLLENVTSLDGVDA